MRLVRIPMLGPTPQRHLVTQLGSAPTPLHDIAPWYLIFLSYKFDCTCADAGTFAYVYPDEYVLYSPLQRL